MGELLSVFSGMFFAISTIMAQRGMRKASASAGVTINLFFNNLLYAAFLVLTSQLPGLRTLNLEGVLYAVGGGLMGNVLGRTLNYQAVRRIGSARSISLSLSQTLFAFVFSVLLLGEAVTFLALLGVSFVVLGVLVLTREQVSVEGVSASVASTKTANAAAVPIDMLVEMKNPQTADTRTIMISGIPRTKVVRDKAMLLGGIFAIVAGLAYSGADLSRKLSLVSLPSAVVSSAIGGFAALLLQSIGFSLRGGWHEIRKFDRRTVLNFCASGLTGGLAIILLNSALSRSPIVIVNALYNMRVWFTIAISPLLLGVEGKITKVLVLGTVLMIIGTSLIIFGANV